MRARLLTDGPLPHRTYLTNGIRHLVSREHLQHLIRSHGRAHPLVALGDPITATTAVAVDLAYRTYPSWTERRTEIARGPDSSSASAALAEIRALGALLAAGIRVDPEPLLVCGNARPDFRADTGDGSVVIEVHAPQESEAQRRVHAQRLDDFNRGKALNGVAERAAETYRVRIMETERFPTGMPDPSKPTDSVLTNTISKIARIKQRGHQIDPTEPFVLWVDLQDPAVWGLPLSPELLEPVYSEINEGLVASGPLWYALYGRKGDPMMDASSGRVHQVDMLHDGRFVQPGIGPATSAVVFALSSTTALMENPAANHPLPAKFRRAMVGVPWFQVDRSLCEWTPGLLQSLLDLQRATASSLIAQF